MPRVSTTRGYKGKGHVSLTPLNGLGRKFRLGNVIALSESIETDRQSREDFQEAGGGELDVQETVTSMTFECTVNDIKPETIAIGLRADFAQEATGAVVDEPQPCWAGERVSLDRIPDPDQSITVKLDATDPWEDEAVYAAGALIVEDGRAYIATVAGTSGTVEPSWPTNGGTVSDGTVTWRDLGPTTLVAETHYARTPQGIVMMAATAGWFVGVLPIPLLISYTKNPQYILQALVNAGTEYRMEFDGLNEVDSGNPFVGKYFRVKFSPTSGFNRIGNEFAELTLSGTVLKDENRVGSGLSQYAEFLMI